MIKPDDIPDEIAQKGLTAQFVVDILKLAIEAGLVSPPCHVIKRDDGYVIDPGYERRIRVWPGKSDGPNCEHYWGQES